MTIQRNSAKCNTCDVELESRHRHDFRVHTCPNNFKAELEWYEENGEHKIREKVPREQDFNWGVDGGREYIRRIGEGFTDTSICTDEER
jgi:Zn-finger nucleic acid-binding protein